MKRLLLIEDDADYRQMLKTALASEGYEVMDAADGKEGMQLYRKQPCVLVITDVFMPEQEGLETIRMLRGDFPTVKIIAISGGGTRSVYAGTPGAKIVLEAAQGLGADRVLLKPFELQQLITLIEELLKTV